MPSESERLTKPSTGFFEVLRDRGRTPSRPLHRIGGRAAISIISALPPINYLEVDLDDARNAGPRQKTRLDHCECRGREHSICTYRVHAHRRSIDPTPRKSRF